jgi:histidine ammonia-lyase
MTMIQVKVDGRSLSLGTVERVADDPGVPVVLGEEARERVARARATVAELVEAGEVVYGVTTGFGRLAEVPVSAADRAELQVNLLRSHAAGTGPFLSPREVRVLLLLRANALARGHSGCRPEVVERLLEMLRLGIHPAVPEAGSVGASGDLAPLAHLALPLIGEGEVLDAKGKGGTRPALDALQDAGIEPLELVAKEGLALINGTQATTGLGLLALLAAERALDQLEVAGAMSLEALKGTPEAFRAEVHEARPHPGQIESARILRGLMADSEIRESHRHGDPRVQDAYSLRCMPQVHGAARSGLGYVREVLAREVNAATDNPLVFPESRTVVSAGNFHAQVVAQVLDLLCIVAADLAAISERRLERLLNPDLSGLPAFLAPDPGIHSGYMILQVTVVDLLSEMRVLAHPASVDSVPTSAGQEDHVSMGMAAARKARRAVVLLETVAAAELLAAAQGLEFHRPLRAGRGVERAYGLVRERVEPLTSDRRPAPDLEELVRAVRAGAFLPERADPARRGD